MTNAPTRLPPTLAELRERREEILRIAARHKASHVRVFGSIARGDRSPDSDVDFLVNFEDGASLYDLAGLFLDLQELLGVRVDVVEDHAGLRERFRERVLKDAVAL